MRPTVTRVTPDELWTRPFSPPPPRRRHVWRSLATAAVLLTLGCGLAWWGAQVLAEQHVPLRSVVVERK